MYHSCAQHRQGAHHEARHRRKQSSSPVLRSAPRTANAKETVQSRASGRFTVEHFGQQLVLDQKDTTVTRHARLGRTAIRSKLKGGLAGDTLTFSGDSSGGEFHHPHRLDRMLKGGRDAGRHAQAHFVDSNDAHQVVRTRDQEIPWTATPRTSWDRALLARSRLRSILGHAAKFSARISENVSVSTSRAHP